MRRKDKEITGKKEIRSIIEKAQVCRLAMTQGAKPYLVPLCFGITGNTLYFHCAREGKKLNIIKKNPHVCFEFETGVELVPSEIACKIGMKFQSVIGFGRARIVEDKKEKLKGLCAIVRHYSKARCEFPPELLEKTLIFRVEINKMTGKKSG
jgi:uncharacterized protein